MTSSMSELPPLQLFCSYSHQDEAEKENLIIHLASLKHSGLISEWHDRLIMPGQNWENEIDTHLESADVVLLLLSASFIASDYCYGIEMKRALERHKSGSCIVIPIMLKAFDAEETPFKHIQGLPKNLQPVSSWDDANDAWADVAQGIRKVCQNRAKAREQASIEMPLQPRSQSRSLKMGYTTDRLDSTIYQIAWSPDCRYVATGDNNRQISIWSTDPIEADFKSGEFKLAERVDLLEKDTHSGVVKALAWDPTGQRLASSGSDKTILIWDIDFNSDTKSQPTRRVKGHFSAVNSLIWISRNRLISGSDDTEIMVWNPVTGDKLSQFTNANRKVICMAISPDDRLLAVGGCDGVVRIFDWMNETIVQALQGHGGEIYSVAWSSNQTLASASEDKEIRLWDLSEPSHSKVLSGHADGVVSVSFSGDGRLLASQSSDMTLRFWNAVEATPVDFFEWECSEHPNVGMKFDAVQPLLVSLGKRDHAFRIWQVSVEELIQAASKRTYQDNQAWNRYEAGFISTSLRNSKQHRLVRDACEEAGHNPIRIEIQTAYNSSEMKAEVLNSASVCDFYLGVFHLPEDCVFAEAEIQCFLNRSKKVYFFFPEVLDDKRDISASERKMYRSFKERITKAFHVYSYQSDGDLVEVVQRVLKNRLSTRRDMLKSCRNGLYPDRR